MPVILHCTPDGIEFTTDFDSHMPYIDRYPPSETSETLYFIIYMLTRAPIDCTIDTNHTPNNVHYPCCSSDTYSIITIYSSDNVIELPLYHLRSFR